MRDVHHSDPEWKIVLLRYFNPIGSHPSGRIGEDPAGYPNNLMPFVQQVAVGRRDVLTVFGTDYKTRDGTGVRDYIHVMDLASGYTKALDKLFATPDIGCAIYNLGTGRGTTVLELVAAFEKASERKFLCNSLVVDLVTPVSLCCNRESRERAGLEVIPFLLFENRLIHYKLFPVSVLAFILRACFVIVFVVAEVFLNCE